MLKRLGMIQNLITIIMIFVAAPTLIFIMFLPALLELTKPKDGGPRIIMGKIPELRTRVPGTIFMPNIACVDEEQKFDGLLIQAIARIIEVLPSLEV